MTGTPAAPAIKTLIEKAQVIVTTIDRVKRTSELSELLGHLETRRKMVGDFERRLRLVRDAAHNMAEHDVECPVVRSLAKIQEAVKVLGALAKPTDMAAPARDSWKAIERSVEEAETAYQEAWESHVDTVVSFFKDEILRLFESVAPATVRDLRIAVEAMKKLATGLPSATATIVEFDRQHGRAKELLNKLLEGTDPDILNFLKQATSRGGAPLGALTQKVSDWIASRRLGSIFSVRVG